jgi:hypothetical protein
MKRFIVLFIILLISPPVYSSRKPHFGGNLRIADTLINAINKQPIFSVDGETIHAQISVPFEVRDNQVNLDFSRLNPELLVELEKVVTSIQDQADSCHWILDYPYFDHRHPNQIQLESGVLKIASEEEEYLRVILTSSCLPPSGVESLQPFRKTQFGFEANTTCLSGRPFLDSITPAPVDPANPYLSFKLNDVDVLPIPEERFLQINSDPELSVFEGSSYLIYLVTSNLQPQDIALLTSGSRVQDIAKVVLNDHAEVLIGQQTSQDTLNSPRSIEFKVPEEDPYRLLGERLVLEWQELGFTPSSTANSKIEIVSQEMTEGDEDLFRYNLLRTKFQMNGSKPWFEIWDEMEASGKILPLLIHKTQIAARKNVVNLHGALDFANTWIIPEQQ